MGWEGAAEKRAYYLIWTLEFAQAVIAHARRCRALEKWQRVAERFADNLTPERAAELAALLRLPCRVIAAVPLVGADKERHRFTIPETDAAGNIVGISTRSAGGKKGFMLGGHRGLIIPTGWAERPGSIFCVEGASDTFAMTAAGLACVGRPSAAAGYDHLRDLFRTLPADRPIVIVGDNDKDEQGRKGAESLARKLSAGLSRVVRSCTPPVGAKDVRDWLAPSGPRVIAWWVDRGRELSSRLLAAAEPTPK